MVRLFLVGLVLLATAAPAQIAPTSPSQQRAADRRARREAQRTETPYKDGHLAAASQPQRRGSAGRPARVAHEPRFGRNGAPRVAKPLLPGLRRRSQNEPKP